MAGKQHHHHHAHLHPVAPMPTRREILSFLISAAVLPPWAMGQQESQSASEIAERFHRMSEDYEKEGLAEPFKGITTNGEVVPGLFEIKADGSLNRSDAKCGREVHRHTELAAAGPKHVSGRRHRVA